MSELHVIPVRTNLIVFGALMFLLVLTIGVAYIDLGPLGIPIALSIAMTKAVIIMMYFMHVRFSPRLIAIFAASALVWLGILLALSLSDYLSRGWLQGIAGK